MLIRETRIIECWCTNCGAGQMKNIVGKAFPENIHLIDLVGEKIKCHSCGTENEIEDIISLIPESFMVGSFKNQIHKNCDDIGKFVNEQ